MLRVLINGRLLAAGLFSWDPKSVNPRRNMTRRAWDETSAAPTFRHNPFASKASHFQLPASFRKKNILPAVYKSSSLISPFNSEVMIRVSVLLLFVNFVEKTFCMPIVVVF